MENIFDRDYQLNKGYNQEGREWQLGLTYTF
jgi:outer membrane cobalamin receptor